MKFAWPGKPPRWIPAFAGPKDSPKEHFVHSENDKGHDLSCPYNYNFLFTVD